MKKPNHKLAMNKFGIVAVLLLIMAVSICFFTSCARLTANTKSIVIIGTGKGDGVTASAAVKVAEQTIPAAGGTIQIDKSGSPVQGLTLDVPNGAYPSDTVFSISTSEILAQGFDPAITLISPLIHVENGGTFAGSPMMVKVPCVIPDDATPMAFYYDSDTKKLEYIPVVDFDKNSVTFAVEHFSTTVIGYVKNDLTSGTPVVNSGFTPGVDDFALVNNGSSLTPRGECMGQTLAALWYYNNMKSIDGPLYGKYDDFTKDTKMAIETKGFQQDDVLAYRLGAVIQNDVGNVDREKVIGKFLQMHLHTPDQVRYRQLVAAMKLLGPQLIFIYATDSHNEFVTGHAIIAYKVDGDKIYVSDPNFPGNTSRFIQITNGKFIPYSSAENNQALQAGNVTNYSAILPTGNMALTNTVIIARSWGELENRTVGDGKFLKTSLELYTTVKDETGKEQRERITNGYTATSQDLIITEAVPTDVSTGLGYWLYYTDSTGNVSPILMKNTDFNKPNIKVTLKEGDNYIGWLLLIQNQTSYNWHDFQWLKVTYGFPTMDDLVGEYTTTVTVTNGASLKYTEQNAKSAFIITKVTDEQGILSTDDSSGGTHKSEIPFTYKKGVLTLNIDDLSKGFASISSYSFKASFGKDDTVLINGTERIINTESESDFYIETILASKPRNSQ